MFNDLRIGSKAKSAQKFTPVHPDPAIGDKHGVSLMLHGKHSEVYRNAVADMLRRTKGEEATPESTARESARLIAACCESYEGGDSKKFDREELAETLTHDDYRWMRLQAERFMSDDGNFF